MWKLVNFRTASVLLFLFNFIVIFKRTFDVSLFYSISHLFINNWGRLFCELRVCELRVCELRVCKLRVCKLRVCELRVYELRVCKLRVCELRVCEFATEVFNCISSKKTNMESKLSRYTNENKQQTSTKEIYITNEIKT